MNTQTHLLLGVALVGTPSARYRPQLPVAPWLIVSAALIGALIPDASIYVMYISAKLSAMPERQIWQELYYSQGWQTAGAVSNSAPLFGTILALAWFAGGRLAGAAVENRSLASAALAFSISALLHLACDLPLHAGDGHPHFWPLSNWIFVSPVSYWDPAHHGSQWAAVELALSAGIIILLWRRHRSLLARGLLSLAASSYAVVAWYWSQAFN